jgi:hypothetical protein
MESYYSSKSQHMLANVTRHVYKPAPMLGASWPPLLDVLSGRVAPESGSLSGSKMHHTIVETSGS